MLKLFLCTEINVILSLANCYSRLPVHIMSFGIVDIFCSHMMFSSKCLSCFITESSLLVDFCSTGRFWLV